MPLAHFEEAVEDEDEFRDIGGKSSAKYIFLNFAMDFLTEAPAFEHLFRNWSLPNCEAPVFYLCIPPLAVASNCALLLP